jgi:hypothetical protein
MLNVDQCIRLYAAYKGSEELDYNLVAAPVAPLVAWAVEEVGGMGGYYIRAVTAARRHIPLELVGWAEEAPAQCINIQLAGHTEAFRAAPAPVQPAAGVGRAAAQQPRCLRRGRVDLGGV